MTPAEIIDSLERDLATLVARRQSLRAASANAEELERNRLEIGELQRRLARALIARYLPGSVGKPLVPPPAPSSSLAAI